MANRPAYIGPVIRVKPEHDIDEFGEVIFKKNQFTCARLECLVLGHTAIFVPKKYEDVRVDFDYHVITPEKTSEEIQGFKGNFSKEIARIQRYYGDATIEFGVVRWEILEDYFYQDSFWI